MIELADTDQRKIQLTATNSVMNSVARIKLSDTETLWLTDNGRPVSLPYGGGHVTCLPSTILDVDLPEKSLRIDAEEGLLVLVDDDYLTPSNSLYHRIRSAGPYGLETQIGIYLKIPDLQTYTQPLWDFSGRTVGLGRNKPQVEVRVADFLQSIDDVHVINASPQSQKDRHPNDTGTDDMPVARHRSFGGGGRGERE